MQINLLHEEFQLQLMVRSRIKTWLVLWTCCLVLTGGLCAIGGWQLQHLHRRSESVQLHIQPLKQRQNRTARLEVELANLRAQTSATESILPPDNTLPLLAVLSQSAANTDGEIQTLRLTMQSTRPRVETSDSKNAATSNAPSVRLQVTIHGSASGDQAVSQFVSLLRSYEIFSKVELKSSSESTSNGEGGRHFHLELVQ